MKSIILTCQNFSGDTSIKITWNPKDPESVEKQRKIFKHLQSQGYIFFKCDKTPDGYEKKGDIVGEFSPELKELLADVDLSKVGVEEVERDKAKVKNAEKINPDSEEFEEDKEWDYRKVKENV